MIRNTGMGGKRRDKAVAGPIFADPLSFPNADGPGPSLGTPGSPDPVPRPAATHPWPITPVLTGALCAIAGLSIALHDGLGLRASWVAALTLAIAAPAGLVLARRLNRPIQVLSARAEQLAVRYTGRAVGHGRNDIENLVAAFDAMTGALLGQLERLKGLHLEELQNSLELQRRYALMRVLRNVSTAALECHQLEQVLERTVDELGGYLDWPIGRVLIVGDPVEGRGPAHRSVWFVGEPERFASFVSASEALGAEYCAHGLIGLAGTTGMPHWVTDLDRLGQWQRHDVAVQSGLKSGFVIPIAGDGSTHAFLEFFADHRVEASAEMIELIEAIHSELWQAGLGRRARWRRGPAAPRPAAADPLPLLQAVGAASR
jgi:hypothetical protein